MKTVLIFLSSFSTVIGQLESALKGVLREILYLPLLNVLKYP